MEAVELEELITMATESYIKMIKLCGVKEIISEADSIIYLAGEKGQVKISKEKINKILKGENYGTKVF